MFRNTSFAASAVALGLLAGVAQAQNGGFAQPAGYPLPGGFTQPAGYSYPGSLPVPVPAPLPVVALEPPVRLGFQWAMCDYGMNIAALREGGLAQQVGLLPGDIIVQINTFQIAGWNEYCQALQDAVYARGGQVEMWLYRPTPAGYELQYVAFTIHEEQIIVVVPCCYHEEKCHSHQVGCWVNRLVYLNQCWTKHCHNGGQASNHCGLNVNFLGKGLNFNKGGFNFGNFNDQHGNQNFGNFKFNDLKSQFKNFDSKHFDQGNSHKGHFQNGSFNFEKHFNGNSNGHHGSSFNNSMKHFSSQMSHGMKSFGGSHHK